MSDSEEKVVESKKDKKDKKKDKKKDVAEAEPVEEAPVEEKPEKSKKSKKTKAAEEEPAPVEDEPEAKPTKSDKKSKKDAPKEEPEEEPVEEEKSSKKDKKKDSKAETAPAPAEPKKKDKAAESKPAPVEEPKKKDEKKDDGKKKGKEPAEVKEKVVASKKATVESDDEAPAPKKAKAKAPVQESESEEEDDEPDNRKKLLIIGATGSVGQVLLNQTLREQTKYAVFPMVRNVNSLTVQQRSLSADVIVGQCTKKEDVENAVDGVDTVFVCLGHKDDSPADLIHSSVKNVLDAMKKLKVHRLIVLAHAAINDYGDKNTISRKLLKTMKGASDKANLSDLEKTSQLLETEGGTIDWIMVRPSKLTNDPIEAKGKYKTGKLDVGPTDKISRADVAHFMLASMTDDTFIRKRPMVSY